MLNQFEINALIYEWNKEFSDLILNEEVFSHAFIASKTLNQNASMVLKDNNQLIGLLLAKDNDPNLTQHIGYLSFIYVFKPFRNQGFGEKLVSHMFSRFKQEGKKIVHVMGDMEPLFPGIYGKNDQRFFKRWFKETGNAYNLIRTQPFAKKDVVPFYFEHSTTNTLPLIEHFIETYFSKRWALECKHYASSKHLFKKHHYIVLKDKDIIIGFIRANTLNAPLMHNTHYHENYESLGGLGPLGIHPDYRKKGLAKALIHYASNWLFEQGSSDVLVDWTGLKAFYENLGFSLEHHFRTYEKNL